MLLMHRLVALRAFTCFSPQFRVQSVPSLKFILNSRGLICNKASSFIKCHESNRYYCTKNGPEKAAPHPSPPANAQPQISFDEELAQLSFFQRYKKLLKEYWYVLIPAHFVTSAVWFGSLFLLAKSGIKIDINAILNFIPLPESLEKTLKSGHLGALALALALYKLVSPFRYMSTVYIAVPAIKILVRRGIIKPLNSTKSLQTEITKIRNRVVKKRGSR